MGIELYHILLLYNILYMMTLINNKKYSVLIYFTADTDLLKMVHVKILLNFEYYFCTLLLGFRKFLSGIVFLHY